MSLRRSLGQRRRARRRSSLSLEAIYQGVRSLGASALPTLFEALLGSELESARSCEILARLASEGEHSVAIQTRGSELVFDPCLDDEQRMRVASLLHQLGCGPEELPALQTPDETAASCVQDLASCLRSPWEVAKAVDCIVADMSESELVDFMEDVAHRDGEAGKRLIEEMLVRDDLSASVLSTLRGIDAELTALKLTPLRLCLRSIMTFLARQSSGRFALVAHAPLPGPELGRYRAISMLMSAEGALEEIEFLDEADQASMDRFILQPLLQHRYSLEDIGLADARQFAISAIRCRQRLGLKLPREYYLGRDLLGLRSEHLRRRVRHLTSVGALLGRGTELMSRGKFETARELLLQYVEKRPDEAEGFATLGSCLMELGAYDDAERCLCRASWLQPGEARYHWNRAALADRRGRHDSCYLALLDYLRCEDASEPERRRQARAYVTDYEERLLAHTPDCVPSEHARYSEAQRVQATSACV